MSIESLVNSLESIRTPCAKYACPMRKRCADESLACTAFLVFAEYGKIFSPYDHFETIYDSKPKPQRQATIDATRENFNRLMVDERHGAARTSEVEDVVFNALACGAPTSAFNYAISLQDLPDLETDEDQIESIN